VRRVEGNGRSLLHSTIIRASASRALLGDGPAVVTKYCHGPSVSFERRAVGKANCGVAVAEELEAHA
jgi:hypothetical protein